MRLIDADKAKAELLRIARDIHDCCGFYDGLKAEYCEIANKRIASIGKDIPLFEQDLNV